MAGTMTVADVLERVQERRRKKSCPECDSIVSIRGIGGEYRWKCRGCEAIGIGFRTRRSALDGLERRAE